MDEQANQGGHAVYAIATMDTKGDELKYVADCLQQQGLRVITVDVGTLDSPTCLPDISRETVASCHAEGSPAVLTQTDRGRAVGAMSIALQSFLLREHRTHRVSGVIGLGGTGGTALITPALQALPVGLPKVMVSTVAGGNVAAYVGSSDLLMFPSIVDVAGLNRVSRQILSNAAHALAGMVKAEPLQTFADRPAIGMTMFGVTTPCVSAVRVALEKEGFDPLVFHATGTGGRSLDKLVASRLIRGVLDITTTEVADEIVGGIFPAGPDRFDAIIDAGVPYVLSPGALDMVNFGGLESVPEQFRNRQLHVHNSQITLMRTTPEENILCARWIATKVNRSHGPLAILIPEKGVSALDAAGQPFYDPQANAALFEELERSIEQTSARSLCRLPYHINDPEFSAALVRTFQFYWSAGDSSPRTTTIEPDSLC